MSMIKCINILQHWFNVRHFFQLKFLAQVITLKYNNDDFLVKLSEENIVAVFFEFTTRIAKITPIVDPIKTSHQWCLWSATRETAQKLANIKNTHWMVGIKNWLRSFGERAWKNLKWQECNLLELIFFIFLP